VINGMGGNLYSGVPSRDVAIALAVDFERYGLDDDDEVERRDVTVQEADEGFGPYTLVAGRGSRGLGIIEVHRCPTCMRLGHHPDG